MPTRRKMAAQTDIPITGYHGKQTRTGNSSGFRFEGALFRSHPEFKGEVVAHVIAPGRLLVTAEAAPQENDDPVMASFLAFIAHGIVQFPETVCVLNSKLAERIDQLVGGVQVEPNASLGDEDLL